MKAVEDALKLLTETLKKEVVAHFSTPPTATDNAIEKSDREKYLAFRTEYYPVYLVYMTAYYAALENVKPKVVPVAHGFAPDTSLLAGWSRLSSSTKAIVGIISFLLLVIITGLIVVVVLQAGRRPKKSAIIAH